MTNTVSLVRVPNSEESQAGYISKAMDLADFSVEGSVNDVIIKPNLCYYWSAATGQTTDPRFVAAIIDVVRERYGKDVRIRVAEADASAMRTRYAFPVLGYEKLAQEKKIELVNLSESKLVKKKAYVGDREISFDVPELLLKPNLFISVPKLKAMRETKVTCAMKNIFGCIGYKRKVIYHPFLEEAIVGINMILQPHVTIVDGLVALGSFPIRLGLIIAGTNPFCVDWVVSEIIGYNPSSIKFLQIAMRQKSNSHEPPVTRGESPEEFRRIFPKPGFSTNAIFSIQTRMLRFYSRIVGDVVPPFLEDT